MNFIEPKATRITSYGFNKESILKDVEKVGRICWNSQDKATEDSYESFTKRLKNLNHFSPFEHGTIYLMLDYKQPNFISVCERYRYNPYSKIKTDIYHAYITTNYRVILENKWENDLKYICNPTENHHLRRTFEFTLPISISREFIRHRAFSFMELSTRYVNVAKKGLTFCIPYYADRNIIKNIQNNVYDIEEEILFREDSKGNKLDTATCMFVMSCKELENTFKSIEYLKTHEGYNPTPQINRDILNLSTATTLYMTGFDTDWEKFIELRSSKKAHPDAQKLALQVNSYLNATTT